jgi:hypothetical protein
MHLILLIVFCSFFAFSHVPAHAGRVRYVLRPRVAAASRKRAFSLQAFGAELALKNMEYKVCTVVFIWVC